DDPPRWCDARPHRLRDTLAIDPSIGDAAGGCKRTMTIELTTVPERWRLAREGAALVDPVRTGKLLVVADMNHLRAVDAADGAAAWSLDVHDEIAALVAIDAGVVIAVAERAGHRVLMIDHAGKTGWELRERWNVTSQGLA